MIGVLPKFKEKFYKHIEELKLDKIETNRAYKSFDRLINLEKKLNKSIYEIPVGEIGKSLMRNSYQGTVLECNMVNKILEFIDSKDRIDTTDVLSKFEYETSRFYTREEMQDVCESLVNAQDKVILYGLFMGLRGDKYKELLQLKVQDVIFDKNYIQLSDRKVKMDRYFKEILKDCLDPVYGGYYYKFNFTSSTGLKEEGYNLNFDSEYVIKSKPYKGNNNGLEPMKLPSLHTRIQKMQEVLDVSLSTTDINRSGILAEMYDIQQHWDRHYIPQSWTREKICRFIKEKKIKGSPYDLLKIYKQKYNIKD